MTAGKRKLTGLMLLFSIAALFLLGGFFTGEKRLSAFFVEDTMWQQLQDQRTATDAPLLTELAFNEYTLLWDADEGRFFYSLVEGDTRAYDPVVRYQGAQANVRLAIRQTQFNAQSVAANMGIELLAYTPTEYRQYRLICTTLPLMQITGADPTTMDSYLQTPEDMFFYLFDNRQGAPQRVITAQGSFHIRGNTSNTFPKHGFRFTVWQSSPNGALREAKNALLGLRADGDWLLSSVYNDPEKVRNAFLCKLWLDSCGRNNVFGVANGTEYRYVELFFNDRYWGLYALGYPIDDRQLNIRSNAYGYLEYSFKKSGWDASEIAASTNQNRLKGYVLKTEGDTDTDAAWRTLIDYYITMIHTQDPQDLYRIADIGNAADMFLFINLVQGTDHVNPNLAENNRGQLKNIFLTFKNRDGALTALYTPWDLDLTWGNGFSWEVPMPYTTVYNIPPTMDFIMDLNPVFYLLELGDGGIVELLQTRYAQLRADAWSEDAIFAQLDELAVDIFDSGAFARDAARWPEGLYCNANERFTVLEEHIHQRLLAMDAYVAALA